jgi:hypothetical protein
VQLASRLVVEKMPHLRFDALDLKAIPETLVESA